MIRCFYRLGVRLHLLLLHLLPRYLHRTLYDRHLCHVDLHLLSHTLPRIQPTLIPPCQLGPSLIPRTRTRTSFSSPPLPPRLLPSPQPISMHSPAPVPLALTPIPSALHSPSPICRFCFRIRRRIRGLIPPALPHFPFLLLILLVNFNHTQRLQPHPCQPLQVPAKVAAAAHIQVQALTPPNSQLHLHPQTTSFPSHRIPSLSRKITLNANTGKKITVTLVCAGAAHQSNRCLSRSLRAV